MVKRRESSEVVKKRILEAAARLFAREGVKSVSTSRIAEEAGTNKALVFRYFGSKKELVAQILRRELSALKNIYSPVPGGASLENLRRLIVRFVHTDQDLTKLVVRSELEGLAPETYIEPGANRIASMLAGWIESQQADKNLPDAKNVAVMVMGALISLVAIEPWLFTSVGFMPEDYEKRREEIIDVMVWTIAQAMGVPGTSLNAENHISQ